MKNKINESPFISQINPPFDLSSFFDNNLIALALINRTGELLQMNSLFSNITGISQGVLQQNILNYDLFNHSSFINSLKDLNDGVLNEFAINCYLKLGFGKRKFVRLKAVQINKGGPDKEILILLDETTDQSSIEEVIQKIGDSLEKSTDEYSFDSMCLSLSESLSIGMVLIGEYDREENVIHSISFLAKNKFVPEMSFSVEGTPIEAVIQNKNLNVYEDNIQQNFPLDPSLKYWNINSYIGCPLLGSQGQLVGYISVMDSHKIRNISLVKSVLRIFSGSLGRELERMTQEQKIEPGDRRYKAIYDQSPFGIVFSDKTGRLIGNTRFCKMLGYTEDELNELTRKDITHPEDMDAHLEPYRKMELDGKSQFTLYKRYIRKNGSICHVKVTVSSENETTDNLADNFIIVEDITDKIAAKKKLKDSQKLTQSIIETAQDAVITFDHNDQVIEWNNQAAVMFGYSKEEAKQLTFNKLIQLETQDSKNNIGLKEFVKSFKGKETIERMEVRAKDTNGKIFPAELSLTPIKVDDGYAYSTFIRDITTYKQYQDILNQNLQQLNDKNRQLKKYIDSNMQLENFAHIASHDLKEPLRSIGNFSQLLSIQLKDKLNETEQEFFNYILTGVKNMNQLIEDLLMYSSVNAQNADVKELNLNDILFIVCRNLDKALLDCNAQLIIGNLPKSFNSSGTKMKQLFQNLIANAIKFKKPDVAPRVEVSCEDIGDYWKFKIEDNGIGIKEKNQDKIFLIFKKLHAKTEYQGTGIGLAVCKKIVDQHGGQIWVESKYGVGTTFYFTMLKTDRCELP